MAGGVCPFRLTWRLLYHAGLTAVLLLITGAQGVLLDIFILAFDKKTSLNYFWLLPDFLMVFPFVAAMCGGYKKSQDLTRCQTTPKSNPQPPIHTRIFGNRAEPVYVWLAYTTLMVAKIIVIFRSQIPNMISLDGFLTPQLLEVTICLTALVFGLLVEGQSALGSEAAAGGDIKAREAYIRGLAHDTAIETLDTVAFLSLLVQSASRLVLPVSLERLILALACINLFLPALTLVKLSHSDYGHGMVNRILPPIYKLTHLWLTNISFMVIRIYLWAGLSASISPFVVKNIYHIFSVLREVWGECQGMLGDVQDIGNCVRACCRPRRVFRGERTSMTLNNVRGSEEWSPSRSEEGAAKFEEIDLKQCGNG